MFSWSDSGAGQFRTTPQVGRVWEEEWPDLRIGRPNVDAFIAWLEWAQQTQEIFDITHPALPGSGKVPNGAGGGTPLVAGGSQTGTSLTIDGCSNSITRWAAGGDVIKIAGLNQIFRIRDDANSNGSGQVTLTIAPPIAAGGSPADNAAITRSGCTLRAIIWPKISMPTARPGHFIRGLRIGFREVP
jgi:hypothetical protein